MNTLVYAVPFYRLKHLKLQSSHNSKKRTLPITFRHCHVSFPFVRQPLSKQLYMISRLYDEDVNCSRDDRETMGNQTQGL